MRKITIMEENKERKKIIMKVGVVSIMVLIFIFWTFNLKNVFNNQSSETGGNKEELQAIQTELNKAVDKMSAGLDKIKATDERLKEASSSLVDELIDKPADMVISSSSVPDSVSNCPAYINCMPTTGEVRACRIPVGCEEITQIAY